MMKRGEKMLRNVKDFSLGGLGLGSAYLALVMGTPGENIKGIIENSQFVQCVIIVVLVAAVTYFLSEWRLKEKRWRIQVRKKAHLLGTDAPKVCVKYTSKLNTKVS